MFNNNIVFFRSFSWYVLWRSFIQFFVIFHCIPFLQRQPLAKFVNKTLIAKMLIVCIFFRFLSWMLLLLFESTFVENFVSFDWVASVFERNFLILSLDCGSSCDWKIDVDNAIDEKNITEKKQKSSCDQFAT